MSDDAVSESEKNRKDGAWRVIGIVADVSAVIVLALSKPSIIVSVLAGIALVSGGILFFSSWSKPLGMRTTLTVATMMIASVILTLALMDSVPGETDGSGAVTQSSSVAPELVADILAERGEVYETSAKVDTNDLKLTVEQIEVTSKLIKVSMTVTAGSYTLDLPPGTCQLATQDGTTMAPYPFYDWNSTIPEGQTRKGTINFQRKPNVNIRSLSLTFVQGSGFSKPLVVSGIVLY